MLEHHLVILDRDNDGEFGHHWVMRSGLMGLAGASTTGPLHRGGQGSALARQSAENMAAFIRSR